MGKRKSIVPLNEARDSFNLFQDQLVPTITDVLRHREVYMNTVYVSEDDLDGELHLVIVERWPGRLRFWTTFVPLDGEKYERLIRKGELLWKPRN